MDQPSSRGRRPNVSRRALLGGIAAATMAGPIARGPVTAIQATPVATPGLPGMTFADVAANGITLRVTELGAGDPVLFCHGFPDTARTWWRVMETVAAAGYHAIAPDMRGYGGSSTPADAALYTPFDTVADMIGLLDALKLPTAVIVGHDWGADVAFQGAMMRPDRFPAVFGLSGAYTPRGDVDPLERARLAWLEDTFYLFQQIAPEADQAWADAARSIPSALYWASGLPPAGTGWDPLDPSRGILRPAPMMAPPFEDPDYVAHNIAEFRRTGFHGGLNYYRARSTFFARSAAFKGAPIRQPSFHAVGKADGLFARFPTTADQLRATGMPGLVDQLELDGVGHWPVHEAADVVIGALLDFLNEVRGT